MEALHLQADIPQKALLVSGGKVLLVLDKKGRWELPGGRLHKGEQPTEGLARELREELGADATITSIIHTFVFVSTNGAAHHVVIFVCTLHTAPEKLTIQEKELRDIRWVGAEEFEALEMRDGYKEALRKFFSK